MSATSVDELFALRGRTALVTGATSGIGLATARLLASAGARVELTGLSMHNPASVAERIGAEDGTAVFGSACDVTDVRQLSASVDRIRDREGRLDIVVCNAGLAADESLGLASLDRMLDIHVRSVVELASYALPLMAEGGGGAFVIVSSIAGIRGNRVIGNYGISKAASAQIARNLAVQWGPAGIRANSISPGIIETDFSRELIEDEDRAEARLGKTPLRRFGRPEHVAGTVLWLASEAGAFVSGANIVVDGGTMISD